MKTGKNYCVSFDFNEVSAENLEEFCRKVADLTDNGSMVSNITAVVVTQKSSDTL